jgi:hypothetical protein
LSGVQRDFGAKGAQVLGVTYVEDALKQLPGYIAEVKPTYPIGYTNQAQAIAFVEGDARDRRTLPQLVFIDRAGRVVAQYKGSSDFLQYDQDREKNIRELVAKLCESKPQ